MSDYAISQIYPNDKNSLAQVDRLLAQEGIKRDGNLDYTCAMYDENYNIIGTGSCFGNTLRCFAVSSAHQGEGLLNEIISHLIDWQYNRGNLQLFLYTKVTASRFFHDLGFYEIARVDGTLVFMENRRTGFSNYLKKLKKETDTALSKMNLSVESAPAKVGAIVMNANPFTLGHQYLAESASAECDLLHIFMVSEDASLVPFSVRKELIRKGTSHLKNVILHESGPYMISNATFPSYFLKDETAVIDGHARLDLAIFSRIAEAIGINCRYVGEEPTSQVTGLYNQIMVSDLPKSGIDCLVLKRKEVEDTVISASTVRLALQYGDLETLEKLVPKTTYDYFTSPAAAPVLKKIREAGNVIHY